MKILNKLTLPFFLVATLGTTTCLLSTGCERDAGDALEDAGDNMKDAAEDTGDAVKEAAEDTGDAVKDATN